MINEAIKDMKQKQNSEDMKFNEVFILLPGGMWCINLEHGTYSEYTITSKEQYDHAVKARDLVEYYEEFY